jgi:peptidoglycan/LPS O-acetylase OafA/YrhL
VSDGAELTYKSGAERRRAVFFGYLRALPVVPQAQMSEPGLGRSLHRIEQADGLRAIACLLVIWQHVSEVYRGISSGGVWLSTMADRVDFGRIGVCAFFAISGFVVPSSIRGRRLPAVVDFAERRFWRLFPPYWFSIPIGILAVWVLWGRQPTVTMVLANTTMLPSLWDQPYAMGHYWTLEVELVFYLACALLYLIGGRINLLASLTCLILSLLAKRFEWLAGTPGHWPFLPSDLSVMFWGCCCRLLHDGKLPARLGRWLRPTSHALIALTALLVLWEPLRWLQIGYGMDSPGHLRLGWGYALGILLFLAWVLLARVRSRPLEWIGKGTYSIYLLHPVVFYIVLNALNSPGLVALKDHHLGLYLAALMPVCVLVGMLGHRMVEVPSDVLRRLLTQPSMAPSREPR